MSSNRSTLPPSGAVGGGGLTDAQLRATPVPISGTVTATTGGLTDTQLRATPVPVSGTVTATTGGLTDTQLRATPVPVSGTVTASGPLTDTQLRATPVPVSGSVTTGGLTDTQLRATPVPVSGTVTTGGLTDTQLRATPVPISGSVTTNVISGFALETGGNLATLTAKDFATQTTLAALTLAQGASGTSATGPMIQGLRPDNIIQPLAVTSLGQLSVSVNGEDVPWFAPDSVTMLDTMSADDQFFDTAWL